MPLQPLDMAKPLGTENFAVQPFMPFPELLVIVSSAVPHFLPLSSQVFPAFQEKIMPPVETEDAGLEELSEFDELDVLFVPDTLEKLSGPDELEPPPVPDVPEELPVLDGLEGSGGLGGIS